jgi:hypothetical protein
LRRCTMGMRQRQFLLRAHKASTGTRAQASPSSAGSGTVCFKISVTLNLLRDERRPVSCSFESIVARSRSAVGLSRASVSAASVSVTPRGFLVNSELRLLTLFALGADCNALATTVGVSSPTASSADGPFSSRAVVEPPPYPSTTAGTCKRVTNSASATAGPKFETPTCTGWSSCQARERHIPPSPDRWRRE